MTRNLTDEDRLRGGRNSHKNRCPECDNHLVGRDTCPFCEACDELGIGNRRYAEGSQ